MSDLTKLTLKGYFEQLRSEVSSQRKSDQKAGGQIDMPDESTHKLLELLIKAVALVEEVYQKDADFLQADHIVDYKSMINTLQQHGIAYKGQAQIIDAEVDQFVPGIEKKPMQKATGSKKGTSAKRKAG